MIKSNTHSGLQQAPPTAVNQVDVSARTRSIANQVGDGALHLTHLVSSIGTRRSQPSVITITYSGLQHVSPATLQGTVLSDKIEAAVQPVAIRPTEEISQLVPLEVGPSVEVSKLSSLEAAATHIESFVKDMEQQLAHTEVQQIKSTETGSPNSGP
ncbi:hypothetical protein F0562_034142 [Nyssa sinensis]|uniref:Uncharacterized protein n=1 Tax=Nyssa sinensis TaxID=561372 RepID=A0A5J5AHY5_9ASTE|nr:hypothetical protein F0562_034142 [Nyssa sinensis]